MNGDKTIDVRVPTPRIDPFEVRIGRRTVQLDKIRIGERQFRKVISQTPMSCWYTDEFDKIGDTSSGHLEPREFDVRRLPDICWQGLSDPLDAMTDTDGDMTLQEMSELISAQTAMHAVVIARTLSLGLDPHEFFSATPEERARRERLHADAPPAFAASATPDRDIRTEPEPAADPAPETAPKVKKAAPASPGGTIFFGNPADVKDRRVIVFDFTANGVTVRAFPQTKASFEETVELTPREIAAFRISIRHVVKTPLDMPHPAAVPDPRAVRTANRVVASTDEGAMLMHLLWRVSTGNLWWAHACARGWYDAERGVGPRLPAMPRLHMRDVGVGEIVKRIGEYRAAIVGITKERRASA